MGCGKDKPTVSRAGSRFKRLLTAGRHSSLEAGAPDGIWLNVMGIY
jgi:hypothetical protein